MNIFHVFPNVPRFFELLPTFWALCRLLDFSVDLLDVGGELGFIEHFPTHRTLGVTARIEKMLVNMSFELITFMTNIFTYRKFALEFWLLLLVIIVPVIQHVLIISETDATLVTETQKLLDVGLHRRELLPLVILAVVFLVQ